jgi:hypothetical protein
VFSWRIGRNDHSADIEWGEGEGWRRGRTAVSAGCYNSSPRDTMSNLAKVVIQLRRERDKAQKTVEQLDRALMALGGLNGLRKGASGAQKFGMKARTMSAEARKRIAAAQRARWAKWKANHRKPRTAA